MPPAALVAGRRRSEAATAAIEKPFTIFVFLVWMWNSNDYKLHTFI